MAKSKRFVDYEKKFDEIIQWVESTLDGEGKKIKIKDPEDLRTLFERLNTKNKKSDGDQGFLSNDFIDKLIETSAAQKSVQTTVGNFGEERTLTPRVKQRQDIERGAGRSLYRYPKGYAFKSSYISKQKGTLVIRFRDAENGRFVSKQGIEEEE